MCYCKIRKRQGPLVGAHLGSHYIWDPFGPVWGPFLNSGPIWVLFGDPFLFRAIWPYFGPRCYPHMAVCHLTLLLKAPAGPRSWSRAHGPGPTVPVPRSQAHGPGPTVPVPRSQGPRSRAHALSLVQVGHVQGPGWARPWSRLGPCLVQVGPIPGPGWARPWSRLGPCSGPIWGPFWRPYWTRHMDSPHTLEGGLLYYDTRPSHATPTIRMGCNVKASP